MTPDVTEFTDTVISRFIAGSNWTKFNDFWIDYLRFYVPKLINGDLVDVFNTIGSEVLILPLNNFQNNCLRLECNET